jgi:hypothetical protein
MRNGVEKPPSPGPITLQRAHRLSAKKPANSCAASAASKPSST